MEESDTALICPYNSQLYNELIYIYMPTEQDLCQTLTYNPALCFSGEVEAIIAEDKDGGADKEVKILSIEIRGLKPQSPYSEHLQHAT